MGRGRVELARVGGRDRALKATGRVRLPVLRLTGAIMAAELLQVW